MPRKLEVVWRSFWMRLLGRMLPGPKDTARPSPTNSDYRVLFIRYERIGDMIMATSLIRNIAVTLPGGKIDVLATPTTAPVLEGNPHVGNVLMLERKSMKSYMELMKRLRRERYTVMVDGRINNPPIFTSTPLLMYAGQARFRVGAQGERKPRIYNVSVPEWGKLTHYIEGSKHLAVPFGVKPESVDWQPEIFLSTDELKRAEEWWNQARSLVAAERPPTRRVRGPDSTIPPRVSVPLSKEISPAASPPIPASRRTERRGASSPRYSE